MKRSNLTKFWFREKNINKKFKRRREDPKFLPVNFIIFFAFYISAGVAFAVIVGIALGLVIGTSMLAIVFTCRKRYK